MPKKELGTLIKSVNDCSYENDNNNTQQSRSRTCNFRISANGLMLVCYMGKDDGPRNHRLSWQLPALGNYGRDNILQRTIAQENVSRDGKFSHICQQSKSNDYEKTILFQNRHLQAVLSYVLYYEENSIVLVIWPCNIYSISLGSQRLLWIARKLEFTRRYWSRCGAMHERHSQCWP